MEDDVRPEDEIHEDQPLWVAVGPWQFALGAGNEWGDQRRQKIPQGFHEYRLTYQRQPAVYLMSEAATGRPVSLSAYLAATRESCFISCQLDEKRMWLCQVFGSRVSHATDRIFDLSDADQKSELSDMLEDGQQLIGKDDIQHFKNPTDLAEFISRDLEKGARKLKSAALKKTQTISFSLKNAMVLVLIGVLIALGYAGHLINEERKQRKAEQERRGRLIAQHQQALTDLVTQFPISSGPSYLKSALSLPYYQLGYQMNSVDCSRNKCHVLYHRVSARVASPALEWARTIDPGASLGQSANELSFTVSVEAELDPVVPIGRVEDIDLMWADFLTVLSDASTRVTVGALSPLPGNQEVGSRIMQGTWRVSYVPMGMGLAVLDGLQRIPGVRFNNMNLNGGQISIGGIYAIDKM